MLLGGLLCCSGAMELAVEDHQDRIGGTDRTEESLSHLPPVIDNPCYFLIKCLIIVLFCSELRRNVSGNPVVV